MCAPVAARLSAAGLLILNCFSSRGGSWYETVSSYTWAAFAKSSSPSMKPVRAKTRTAEYGKQTYCDY